MSRTKTEQQLSVGQKRVILAMQEGKQVHEVKWLQISTVLKLQVKGYIEPADRNGGNQRGYVLTDKGRAFHE